MAKYKLHEIRISFEAPPLRDLNPKSLTVEKNKEFEANFQWIKYAVLFTDSDMNWYSYITPLYPWGTKQKGGQEIFPSDSVGNIEKAGEIDVSVEDIQKEFSEVLTKPELEPRTQVSYINAHKHDQKKYSSEQFKLTFIDSGRYIVLTKDRKFMDPFGKVMGKKGIEPIKEKTADNFRKAIKMAKEKDYFTGGFDIMKKLVKKQHKDQKKTTKNI